MLNLRKERILAGLTQWTLANKTNIPASRISLLERAVVSPTEPEKEVLCAVFNVPASQLFRQIRRRTRMEAVSPVVAGVE